MNEYPTACALAEALNVHPTSITNDYSAYKGEGPKARVTRRPRGPARRYWWSLIPGRAFHPERTRGQGKIAKYISLGLTAEEYEELRALADEEGFFPGALLRHWIRLETGLAS